MTEPERRANGGLCAPCDAPISAARRHSWVAVAVAVAVAACAAALGSLAWPPRPALVWNASPSSALGLYSVAAPARPRRGDLVIAWAPPWARRLAAERGYLPATVPLVKPVAAIAGDRVCAARKAIFVNGRQAAVRRSRDPTGRPMPWWAGCHKLRPGELFLLSADAAAFDGRYFGMTGAAELVGKAKLVWAKAAKGPGDG